MSLTVVQSSVDKTQLRNIIEAALLAAGRPLDENALMGLFGTVDPPPRDTLREVITGLQEEYEGRGIQLAEVASGWRVQVRSEMAPALARLWESRPPRFSRALLETLCLIAYRQPITRGEIEDVRGVSVGVNIVRTLQDRHWIRVVGHRDVPGKPEMFGTTKEFLDYFGLKGLDDLPTLAELRDFDNPNAELQFEPAIDTQIALEGEATAEQAPDASEGDDEPSQSEQAAASAAEERSADESLDESSEETAEENANEGADETADETRGEDTVADADAKPLDQDDAGGDDEPSGELATNDAHRA